jgi:FixJ family two-component response regulator
MREALISIVDDNAAILAATKALIRSMGFQAAVFSSAHQFLSTQNALESSACLIVDFQMPQMTGIELVEKLKRLNKSIPTILMTAYSTPAMLARARDLGIVCCLDKPLDDDDLLEWIRRAIAMGGDP